MLRGFSPFGRGPATLGLVVVLLALNLAADWPMYRSDAARTGRTDQSLSLPLALQWIHQSAHAPRPAWPRSSRMQFDRVFQVVIRGDRVVFGSSVDGIVHGLDAKTGAVAWRFFTDGPIRFAPAIWRDRAFVASDDGFLYCLRLTDGQLLWKRRGGPGMKSVLGNEVMISKWPARGGPVVVDEVVYFAAGIWPSEGIYLYALDAKSGKQLWCNSDSGTINMPQPHGGANAKSGISAQGYLVVSGDHLLVPTGRAVPASFDRKTGKLEYFHLQKYGHNGESLTMAVGDVFFNSGLSFGAKTGEKITSIGTGPLAATEDGVVRAFKNTLAEHEWTEAKGVDRKGKTTILKSLRAKRSIGNVPASSSVIVAGNQVVLGGDNGVSVVDLDGHGVAWSAAVDGVVHGLAAAGNQLLVSTDQGRIYCFGTGPAKTVRGMTASESTATPPPEQAYEQAAQEIVRRSRAMRGYCLDLGCGDGSLALALAKQTELRIIAVDADPRNVARARQRMIDAGVYGARVVVQQRDPASTGYPRYFANLIVCGRAVLAGANEFNQDEANRLQRPYGGVICVGKPGEMQVSRRGPLPGAGDWTHQYADPANTVNSQDQLVKGRLGMLWFRDVDFQLAQRHGRPPAPLFYQGRLYHEGLNGLIAVDAYNGCELGRFEIPNVLKPYNGDELMGVAGTGSNYCVGGDRVYVRHEDRCYQLDTAKGTVLAEYRTSADQAGKRSPWGYIAWADGVLYGSEANDQHVVTYRFVNRGGDMTKLLTESRALFATDPDSGRRLWRYQAKDSIRHNAIAIGKGKVVLIDRPLALFDRVKKPKSKEHPTGALVALDARTGELLWKNDDNIYGTMLAISIAHDVVLMSYQPTRFRLDSELGGRMAALRLKDGTRLWDIEAKYSSRPMINDRTIYVQGGAWDLLTGKPVEFHFKRSYGCGILASSSHMLLFRSATLGYYDLSGARATEDYGGIRPGCWINSLPVGGIVLLPDATAGCRCSYLNRAWIALEPIAD